MFNSSHYLLVRLGLLAIITASAVTPVSSFAPVSAQSNAQTATFYDASDYWARPFIEALAEKNIITGYPDGTFRPNRLVNRAEFAAMIQNAFNQNQVRELNGVGFTDIPIDSWAVPAIEEAYETGFMVGLPSDLFLPNLAIPRVQALVALASGLALSPPSKSPSTILGEYYTDANKIPGYAFKGVAAATAANIVVNYPNVRLLQPGELLTRGEAAAFYLSSLG